MERVQSVMIREERLRGAMIAGDVEALSELIDDDPVFTGPMGNVMTKEEDLGAHRAQILRIRRLDLFDTSLRSAQGVVVVTTKGEAGSDL